MIDLEEWESIEEGKCSPSHEKYTAEYIEREAALLLKFYGCKTSRSIHNNHSFNLTALDLRILRRWKAL